jgi:ABC-2 type transport system ATP-binding protein
MSGQPAVEMINVGLAYRLARSRPATFKEFIIRSLRRQVHYERLWALTDISLEVYPGEVFGVIGPNGAGKSTMMKVIARVLPPTEGRVIVRGSVASMIELGAGFNAELTGEENTIMYGTLLGHEASQVRERVPEIAKWAGVDRFMDAPVRSYSSGMLARLGFAVATDVRPDVMVIDEVLAVGDAEFQEKSRKRILNMIAEGTSVILVSHNLDLIGELADRVIYVKDGCQKAMGPAKEVLRVYTEGPK